MGGLNGGSDDADTHHEQYPDYAGSAESRPPHFTWHGSPPAACGRRVTVRGRGRY